jgi:hypothetical protein
MESLNIYRDDINSSISTPKPSNSVGPDARTESTVIFLKVLLGSKSASSIELAAMKEGWENGQHTTV